MTGEWTLECDEETFAACRKDEKFSYIVALARAVNALNFTHSAMIHAGAHDVPEARRERFNSYLFASAVLYEGLKLIRAMSRTFKADSLYMAGLHSILRDSTAQQIEKQHLNPARNNAVYHFLPSTFALAIKQTSSAGCSFVSGVGDKKKDIYYGFADVIAAEILVGTSAEHETFDLILGNAMKQTRKLVVKFADDAEILISYYMKQWGFEHKLGGPTY